MTSTVELTCNYCGGPAERIEVTSFSGPTEYVAGECEARCVKPRCITCHRVLTTDHRCVNLDCPVAHVIQPEPA